MPWAPSHQISSTTLDLVLEKRVADLLPMVLFNHKVNIKSYYMMILMVQQFGKNRETKQKWHFQRDFQKSNWTRLIIQLKSHVCGVVRHQLKLRIVSWWYHVCGIAEWNSCLKFLQNCFVTFSGLISLYFMCQTWKHCWRISILCKTAEFPSCHNKIEDYSTILIQIARNSLLGLQSVKRFIDAARFNDISEVVSLLRSGLPIDSQDENGYTALYWAVSSNHTDIVDELIRVGADVNIQNHHHWTPLHAAAQNNNTDIVEALLRHGAIPSIRNKKGQTALDVARMFNKEEAIRLLEQ